MRIPKPCLSVPLEKKSLLLRQYQSYISNNWWINGKVFMSSYLLQYTLETQKFELLFKKIQNWILTCDELRQYQS